ncbi:uncharacterized protein LOC125532599 [Triticum urartu]|uniref:uncharacterized protein LOC125532599 n=1 Tax=Triticum urartu TaxID=4572 RepID=UPI002043735E|nr:uncharacterized protein LOC125532599 [Triticum urartu]
MAPVVTAALGALGPLLGKLADLLAGECSRLKGVRREIRSLQSEFKGFDSPKFSIELHHGGFFMGKGNNLAYLDEKLSLFDNLDRNTFCNDMIDYMLQQLNYALIWSQLTLN